MNAEDNQRERLVTWLKHSDSFLGRHGLLWAEILIFILLYICNRYEYQRELVMAERLRREMVDLQYQRLNVTSDISAKSKPSYVEKVVEKNTTGLTLAGESPVRLEK